MNIAEAEHRFIELESSIENLMNKTIIPGLSIAYLVNGETVKSKSFGVKSMLTGYPVGEDTVFEAASLTKPVFAYCVLKLVERGLLDLHTPLYEYCPVDTLEQEVIGSPRGSEGFNWNWFSSVNARMVLSHTSGLPHESFSPLIFNHRPGDRWKYSSYGYEYLQKVIENILGEPLDKTMSKLVLKPLDMNDSRMKWENGLTPKAAVGHNLTGYTDGKIIKQWTPISSVSLYTTARDYSRFIETLLSDKTLENMMTPQIRVKENISWGLGLGLEDTVLGKAIWHWGDTGTFRSFFKIYLESGSGVIYFTNSFNGLSVADEITSTLFGNPENRGLFMLNYAQYSDPRIKLLRTYAYRDIQEGENLYHRLVSLYPLEFTWGNMNSLGHALIYADRSSAAIALYNLAIRNYPFTPELLMGLSDAELANGKLLSARETLLNLVKVMPDYIEGIWSLNMLEVLRKLRENRKREAEKFLVNLEVLQPDQNLNHLCEYSLKLSLMNRKRDAIRFLEFCTNIYSDAYQIHLQAGRVCMMNDCTEKAIEYFKKATEINPYCWQARQLLEQMVFNEANNCGIDPSSYPLNA